MKNYIVAYDIVCEKRAYRVRKFVYSFALGGQKSVLETPFLNKRDLNRFIKELKPLLHKDDSVNIIEVEENITIFGKADILGYDRGLIII